MGGAGLAAACGCGADWLIARDATLITRNGKDFRRIDGLKLEEWPPIEG